MCIYYQIYYLKDHIFSRCLNLFLLPDQPCYILLRSNRHVLYKLTSAIMSILPNSIAHLRVPISCRYLFASSWPSSCVTSISGLYFTGNGYSPLFLSYDRSGIHPSFSKVSSTVFVALVTYSQLDIDHELSPFDSWTLSIFAPRYQSGTSASSFNLYVTASCFILTKVLVT